MRVIKKHSYSLEEIDKALEKPCFFCGSTDKFVFYVNDINKTVCIDCVGSSEVEQFYALKKGKTS